MERAVIARLLYTLHTLRKSLCGSVSLLRIFPSKSSYYYEFCCSQKQDTVPGLFWLMRLAGATLGLGPVRVLVLPLGPRSLRPPYPFPRDVTKDGNTTIQCIFCAAFPTNYLPEGDRHHHLSLQVRVQIILMPSGSVSSLFASTTTPRALCNQRTQSVPRHSTPVVIEEQVRGLPFYSQCQCHLNFALRLSREVSLHPGPQTDSTIPARHFQAHAFTIANNVIWIFGRCDDIGRFKEVWCFIGACARDKSSSLWWPNY